MMVDQNVANLTALQAVGVGAGSMILSWIVYDLLCRSPLGRNNTLLGAIVFALMVGLTWGLTHLPGGRACGHPSAGACIGTIMVANVFFLDHPGAAPHGRGAMREGPHAGSARRPARENQRSVHNNYFTLPVLFDDDGQSLRRDLRVIRRHGRCSRPS